MDETKKIEIIFTPKVERLVAVKFTKLQNYFCIQFCVMTPNVNKISIVTWNRMDTN